MYVPRQNTGEHCMIDFVNESNISCNVSHSHLSTAEIYDSEFLCCVLSEYLSVSHISV